ncbi:hypothetical protein [Streptomyces apocyni]|uniref:hypothetical protein n=1 Tax=Streptomyces apocyni TaxID=2654677 RepID=UPI0012EA3C9A|nr:hypothetical protein [Streptomyces apocyni]
MSPLWGSDRHRDAYVALLDHAAACPECRAQADVCPEGRRLADALRVVRSEVCAS